MYYIEEIHRTLPKNKKVIRATLDLIRGQTPSLAIEMPAYRAAPRSARETQPVEVEAEQLRLHFQDGTANEEQLSQLYFAF